MNILNGLFGSKEGKAIDFAHKAHRGQTYGGMSYGVHLATVASLVPARLRVAAYLHDTLEDTRTTYVQLCDQFGRATADLVKELTAPPGETAEQKMSRLRALSGDANTIKIADSSANLMSCMYDVLHDDVLFRREKLRWANDYACQPQMAGTDLATESRKFLNSASFEKYTIVADSVHLTSDCEMVTFGRTPIFYDDSTLTPRVSRWEEVRVSRWLDARAERPEPKGCYPGI